MKTFKQIDWIVQIVIMTIPLLVYTLNALAGIGNNVTARNMISLFYLGVGSWQIISVIIHFFFPSTVKIRMRKVYLILLSLTIVTGIIFQLMGDDNILGFLIGLLFWSPVLALLYLITSIIETNKMKVIIP